MERTLTTTTKTPHEKSAPLTSRSAASIGTKRPMPTARNSSKGPTATPARHGRPERSSVSATAQAVKKLAQMPSGHTDRTLERGRGGSRSVNYLSSTAASRAKAASAAQIHKPAMSVSVNKLLAHGGAKSEATLRTSRRPRSATNKDMTESGRGIAKGKSRSQASFKPTVTSTGASIRRKSVASAEMLRSKSAKRAEEGNTKKPLDKARSSSAAAIGNRKATSSLSSTLSQNASKSNSRRSSTRSGRLIRVTMNRTSELRAALHRPVSVKRSGGKSDSIASKSARKSYRAANASITRDSGKSKRRPRKKASSMDSAVNKNPTEMAKAILANDVNENERDHGFRI